ncbi:hypothetical protein EYF80_054562 [Liparis tanakae]|uniref:Uncharacterized protein n=1 Tax=Liparis tanakae TaxID=230148 RepID=A0A4Z2F2A7_9TELE|nr:hypothetical protein EYF80_054562 [Liparis tanakae]
MVSYVRANKRRPQTGVGAGAPSLYPWLSAGVVQDGHGVGVGHRVTHQSRAEHPGQVVHVHLGVHTLRDPGRGTGERRSERHQLTDGRSAETRGSRNGSLQHRWIYVIILKKCSYGPCSYTRINNNGMQQSTVALRPEAGRWRWAGGGGQVEVRYLCRWSRRQASVSLLGAGSSPTACSRAAALLPSSWISVDDKKPWMTSPRRAPPRRRAAAPPLGADSPAACVKAACSRKVSSGSGRFLRKSFSAPATAWMSSTAWSGGTLFPRSSFSFSAFTTRSWPDTRPSTWARRLRNWLYMFTAGDAMVRLLETGGSSITTLVQVALHYHSSRQRKLLQQRRSIALTRSEVELQVLKPETW